MVAQLEGLSAIVTGGTAGVGEAVARLFHARGARVGAVELARRRFGGLDVLVNNAGMDYVHEIASAPLADVRRVMEVNLVAPLAMIQAVVPELAGRGGGCVVNVVSRLASIAVPGMNVYGAAKAALHAITRGAAIELAHAGVRVNSVAPGFTETPLMSAWLDDQPDPAEARRAALEAIPQRRFATPDDVAAAVAYLASREAGHVTGASLAVDGGYTAQ